MKVKMAAVVSLDGKIQNSDKIHDRSWISEEDKQYFSSLMDSYSLIVMGRKTYSSMGLKPQAGKKYIVMTRNPMLYRASPYDGQVIFTNDTPKKLIDNLSKLGHTDMLLIGGASLYAAFLEQKLVDELDITIEPIVLGSGKSLSSTLSSPVRLSLTEQKQIQLNSRGTVLFKMKVEK